jgi:hypothetical protein
MQNDFTLRADNSPDRSGAKPGEEDSVAVASVTGTPFPNHEPIANPGGPKPEPIHRKCRLEAMGGERYLKGWKRVNAARAGWSSQNRRRPRPKYDGNPIMRFLSSHLPLASFLYLASDTLTDASYRS